MSGPLAGTTVVEIAGIGPAPFGVMLLADLGAEVVRVDRTADTIDQQRMLGLGRGRRSIGVDLKRPAGRDLVLRLADRADVLVEPFRAGVAERLGIGPDDCLARNQRLVYARMSGWGHDGPLADRAGHDINYAAIAGALHPIGHADRPPPPPLNFLADFGGGGLYLALGVLAALVEREHSGRGQVVDAAMVDGAASLTTFFHGLLAQGAWTTSRQANLLDGGAPFYATYEAADGGYVAVGALEPQFYRALLDGLDLEEADWPQDDVARWPRLRDRLAEAFRQRTRDEWGEHFGGTDACVSPVLRLDEAPSHPHLAQRSTFVAVDGTCQPAPAPRLSRTPGTAGTAAPRRGEHNQEILLELGLDADEIARLTQDRIVG